VRNEFLLEKAGLLSREVWGEMPSKRRNLPERNSVQTRDIFPIMQNWATSTTTFQLQLLWAKPHPDPSRV